MPLESALKDGARFAGFLVEPGTFNREEVKGYAAIESVYLASMASEALVRLFFAHVGNPACPWIELTALNNFRDFKSRTQQLIRNGLTSDLLDQVRTVFRGNPHPRHFSKQPDNKAWEDDGIALVELLLHAASKVMDEAPAYNALKHGFGAHPSSPSLTIGDPKEGKGQSFTFAGPAINFLHRESRKGDHGPWQRSVSFISIAASIATVSSIADAVDSLWAVARWRYLGDSSGEVTLTNADQLRTLRTEAHGHGVTDIKLTATYGTGELSAEDRV